MVSDPIKQKEEGVDFTFIDKIILPSSISYTLINNEQDLSEFVHKVCEMGKVYVGQVFDIDTGELAHSFILKIESDTKYICFDKPGFKYSFTVSDLDTILNFTNKYGEQSNKNQKWRFVPLEMINSIN